MDNVEPSNWRRFKFYLSGHIDSAEAGNTQAAFNLLQYVRRELHRGGTIDDRAVAWLGRAIARLSAAELNRLQRKLTTRFNRGARSGPIDVGSILGALDLLRHLSPAETKRLAEKISAKRGRPFKPNPGFLADLERGAYFAERLRVHQSSDSRLRGNTPHDAALEDASAKFFVSRRTAERCYEKYLEWRELGCVDECGKFIMRQPVKK